MEITPSQPPENKNWWKDLQEFFCALWPGTTAKITGGSIAAIMTIISAFGISIPHFVIWALISLAFFASAFNAYRKQRRVVEIQKINFHWPLITISYTVGLVIILILVKREFISPFSQYLTKPNFSTDLIQLTISDDVSNLKNHYINFAMTIFNDGSPSVVRRWYLKISGNGNDDIIPSSIIKYANDWQTNWPTGSTNATLTSTKDSFTGVLNDVPIPRGGQRNGFITFVVNDVSREYLLSHETKYDLRFSDVSGREYDYPNISPSAPKPK